MRAAPLALRSLFSARAQALAVVGTLALGISAALVADRALGTEPASAAALPTPAPFAPESFASEEHTSPGALSGEGATLYLTRSAVDFSRSRIHVSRRGNSGWSAPEPLFEAGHTDAGPALSADGSKLYFHSDRATGLDGISDDWNLFLAERAGDSWSEPRALPVPLNSPKSDCCIAAAPDGSLLFASDRHGSWDIWRAVPESASGGDGAVWRLEKLPEGINSSYMEWPSSVDLVERNGARFERLLMSSIRSAKMGGLGADDLYVAFRPLVGGEWSAPRNLGPLVNGPGFEDSPRLAPWSELLYATRAPDGVSAIHAIAATVLDLLPGPR